jgi:hypothetical protein
MIDREKDSRLSELIKIIVVTSKQMPEMIFSYFSNFDRNEKLKPFYNLYAETFLSIYSFATLYQNQAWSQASAILRTGIEQTSKIFVLTKNPQLLDEFLKLRALSDQLANLDSKEEKMQFISMFDYSDLNEFNNFVEWSWTKPLCNVEMPTRNDVIRLANLGDTLVDIRNILNAFVHGTLSTFDFYNASENTEVLVRFGRRISLNCCKLFYLAYISFKNWKEVSSLTWDTDEYFAIFNSKYKFLVENYN